MPRSKFGDIYRDLKYKIESGEYPYQSLVPSENTLVAVYGCSRNTVRRALAGLIEAGYVQAIQGKGVRVLYRPAARAPLPWGGSKVSARRPAAAGPITRQRWSTFP